MLTQFRRTHNFRRYYKIVRVLARHGFGSFLEYLHADRYLPLPPRLLKQKARSDHISPAEHLRLALEELGPAFIKLGQILSTRPDLLPTEFVIELAKLQDSVPPTSWETILAMLREEYGCEPGEIFSEIDPLPLGSASLSQVHAGRLPDGSQVAIKVQRPDITEIIDADLEILTDLAHIAQRTSWGALYHPVEIVSHFSFTLQNELDYRREAANADRFQANFLAEPSLYIPKIHWDVSTPHVLVMERLYGVKIDALEALDAAGFNRNRVAQNAASVIAKEIMEDGFFHADPHPGNFVIMPGETIGVMDFGMVGYISKSDRINILHSFYLATRQDARGIVEHMLRIGAVEGHVDLHGLERDIARMVNQYSGLPLKYIQTRRVLEELMNIAFQYRINMPPDFWLLFKTLTMMDGLARRLDPDFDIFASFTPHVRRILFQSRMPWSWGASFFEEMETFSHALRDLPNIGENILRDLQRGQFPFSINMGASKDTLDRLDRVATRFSLSILAAAFILGLAFMLPLASGNQIAYILVIIGFVVAFSLGLWLMISILRSGK